MNLHHIILASDCVHCTNDNFRFVHNSNKISVLRLGNPHVAPSLIVTKLMERFQLNDERSHKVMDIINANRPLSAPPTPGPNFHDDVELS